MNNDEFQTFIYDEKRMKSNDKRQNNVKTKKVQNDQKRPDRSALLKFLQNVTHQRIIYKRKIFKQAFSNNLSSIYVSQSGGLLALKKLRQILLSPQINLFIIFLIMIDWLIGVIELTSDLAEEKFKAFEKVEDVAEYVSITILCLFLIEIFLKMFLISKMFFTSFLEIFDAIIVIVSFVFECIFLTKKDYSGIGTILLLFRYLLIMFCIIYFNQLT
jgi:hypothetical protein